MEKWNNSAINRVNDVNLEITRMHSSRMRTDRSLTVCWRLLPGGVWSRGVSGLGGCLVWGVGVWSGRPGPGGGGVVSGPGGGGIPACTEADPPREQNHRRL